MPKLRLVRFLLDVKVFKTANLFSQLNNESNLCTDTEVADAEEADSL